jgi:hypothetical protein
MAWNDLKSAVSAVIKTNGTQAITGAVLQSTLNSIIDQVGANATFKGVATPSTNPGTPDALVFYIASTQGTYANFGGFVLDGGFAVLSNVSGSWAGTKFLKTELDAKADRTELSQLAGEAMVKLTNLITNGNFASGTTGWSFGSNISGASASNGVLSFTGAGPLNTSVNNWVRRTSSTIFPAGNVLYNIVTARSSMGARLYVGIGFSFSPFDLTDEGGTYSHIGSSTNNQPSYGAGTGETVEITNAMCFDLTGIFGEGNEPTKEEMDLLISTLGIDYFEGEISIPAQKLMQWQLKLSITKADQDDLVQLAGEDMILNERYAYEAEEFNDDGIVSSATVIWEDDTSGVLTFYDYNDDWQAYDSYTITYGDKTLVQPKVARDEQGNIINKPLKNIQ